RSWWAGDEPLASWEELERLAAAGVAIGSHTRRHALLPDLEASALADELDGSRRDLEARLPSVPLLAYPHGRSDEAARPAARTAASDLSRVSAGTPRSKARPSASRRASPPPERTASRSRSTASSRSSSASRARPASRSAGRSAGCSRPFRRLSNRPAVIR